MPWNYRVVKQRYDGLDCYGIHEVYYNDPDDDESIWAITEGTVGIHCDLDFHEYTFQDEVDEDAYDEMRQSYLMMGQALLKPVIDLENFTFADREESDDEDELVTGWIPIFEDEEYSDED